ncbi:MAG: phosphoadenylyl-sulfate reductase [Alphaproteobacteria bacterium]|nr:phosphoadenylyl-sulfate reductase [Alphaproteobacteria bacterium]
MTARDLTDLSDIREPIAEAERWLTAAATEHAPAAFASSFGAEDMVLLDMIVRLDLGIQAFTIDTGRLHEETHRLIQRARDHYGRNIAVYAPDTAALESWVRENGPNAFYDGVELRQGCCAIRKVEPLRRALEGKGCWITGQRRQQAATRKVLEHREWDDANGLEKFNPLAGWSTEAVWLYIRRHNVPYNALHDGGFASIGCAPCTRAITVGEDIRAGRWWWEDADTKECGLHVAAPRIPGRAA